MDDLRFDRLTRLLGHSVSRQSMMRLLAGTLAAGLWGWTGGDAGASCLKGGRPCRNDGQCCSGSCKGAFCQPVPRKKHKRRKPKKRKRPDKPDRRDRTRNCPAGKRPCGRMCVNLRTNNRHCGACNRECGPLERCDGGTCQEVCAPGACPGDRCVPMVNRTPGCYDSHPEYARCTDRCDRQTDCPPPDFLAAPLCLYQPGGDCPDTFICGYLS